MHTQQRQVHQTESVMSPDGRQVEIDAEMVDLVKALWVVGLSTVACCQNVGDVYCDADSGVRLPTAELRRRGDFYRGFAYLCMPEVDMQILLGTAEPLRGPDWTAVISLEETGRCENAVLHFPSARINDLTRVFAVPGARRLGSPTP
ncbi:hypothetical protein [Actinocorallia sp. A-T 12471]|uniref:hypothetical protein n=1 Tax=Actinocorallia sp. A-T 12471 TaxID=3089813 RepID=UPI0029CC96C3|nr:hypothetical protein [Actinocorallia sp. A-T 12471]MDX6739202.1 hypothetical protein [Actinocorallia sp. A-T 12471]